VNVHQQQHANIQKQHYANTDPNMIAHQAHQVPHGDAYSVGEAGLQNRGAQAGNVAAHAAGQHQKAGASKKKVDTEELARIVAEENETKGKLPNYPGLERWRLIEKMGDGAFSNVYKARDLSREHNVGEVAIKVVRKFEMNSNQVSILIKPPSAFLVFVARFFACLDFCQRGWEHLGRCSSSSGFQEAA
jgi:hypothetical protein